MPSSMRAIPVDVYPLKKAYSTSAGAITGAMNHSLQSKARADTARLAGTTVVDAYWTDSDHVIRYSNGLFLHVDLDNEEVRWTLTDNAPFLNESFVERIGAPPVTCHWRAHVGVMDRSALAAARCGSEFERLFVNDTALLVYCRGQLIWSFEALRRTDVNQSILWVTEGD